MNNRILENKEKLTESFSRRMQAYALLLNASHQRARTALNKAKQTANAADINKAIAQYEITDTAHMDSCVEVEQRLAEGFGQRMRSYMSALDAIQRFGCHLA